MKFYLKFSTVKAGPPDSVHMHDTRLHLRLEQVSSYVYLQMVHSSRLHALSDCAVCGVGAEGAAAPPLRGPNTNTH